MHSCSVPVLSGLQSAVWEVLFTTCGVRPPSLWESRCVLPKPASAFTSLFHCFLHPASRRPACSTCACDGAASTGVPSLCSQVKAWPHSKIWTRGCLESYIELKADPSWAPLEPGISLATSTGEAACPQQVGGFRSLVSGPCILSRDCGFASLIHA